MDWPRLLAYITGTVDQELLLRNELSLAKIRSWCVYSSLRSMILRRPMRRT